MPVHVPGRLSLYRTGTTQSIGNDGREIQCVPAENAGIIIPGAGTNQPAPNRNLYCCSPAGVTEAGTIDGTWRSTPRSADRRIGGPPCKPPSRSSSRTRGRTP